MSTTNLSNTTQNGDNNKNTGGWKRVITLLGLGAIVATAAIVATSCNRHHRFCNVDAQEASKLVVDRLDDGLDWLDATSEQKSKIFGIARGLVADFFEMKKSHEEHHDAVMAELKKNKPDRQLLHEIVDEKFDTGRLFAHKAVDKVVDAYLVLDADQQAKLLAKIEKHHKRCAE